MIHAVRRAARDAADHEARCRVLAEGAERLMAGEPTTRDWVLLAAAWQDADDPDAARRCLDHATVLGASEAEVELARYLWCGGTYTERPLHARMDAIVRRGARSVGWLRDAAGLFDHLRAGVDDARLRRVAENDYGWQADENLAELRAMCATGLVPRPVWQTLEVLQLERWGQTGPVAEVRS